METANVTRFEKAITGIQYSQPEMNTEIATLLNNLNLPKNQGMDPVTRKGKFLSLRVSTIATSKGRSVSFSISHLDGIHVDYKSITIRLDMIHRSKPFQLDQYGRFEYQIPNKEMFKLKAVS